jgi:hypothetical protein
MSGELEKSEGTGGVIATVGGALMEAVTYTIVITELTIAGARLAGLAETVRSTYRYVEKCATGVDHLADQMAALNVDDDTLAEHREAAGVMRSVLEEAEAMAAATEDLATLFGAASAAHQADYGTVNAAAQSMTVPMADAEFYSNR